MHCSAPGSRTIRNAMLPLRWFVFVFLSSMMLEAASPDTPPDNEQRITGLIARMTLDEKIGQMSQSTAMRTPLSDSIKAEIRSGRWGSFLNAGSPADRAEAQRIAMKETRLGIPLVFGRDVIHGYRTMFPIPVGQSASWDPDLIQRPRASPPRKLPPRESAGPSPR